MAGKEELGFVCKTTEPVVGKYEIVNLGFTISMPNISVSKTMEHNNEHVFVEVYSDSEDEYPPHKTPRNDCKN